MKEEVIISGFGGQGIISAGLMLAEAAVLEGLQATFFPSYGAEMRGGTANCHVIISDKKIASPIVAMADTLIALNEPSIEKFLPMVKENGYVIVNSSVVKKDFDFGKRRVIKAEFEDIAFEKLGNSKMANVITLGLYIKAKNLSLKIDEIKEAIKLKFGKKGEKIVNLNFQALELGVNLAG
jgi:2-oxoglutarate ferredoxin oxidoreductase subunit gamma